MKIKMLAAAIALAAANTYGLEGRVVDQHGEPIEGANIVAAGSNSGSSSNHDGRFKVSDKAEELHISAPGYSHRTVHLHEHNKQSLVVTLSPSVIEQVDVTGLPIHASTIESALPIAVLTGKELHRQMAATLGDTLERLPGVNTSFHGNVASTPVIRGLSGPRVLITQNGLDVSDVSRVGPDHAIASEVSTAQQVEILRGPATLFYGSGAIGGVVNVVDGRVPSNPETRGELLLRHDTVNSQNLASFNGTAGAGAWAFYADGLWRDADDYEVPVAPEQEEHHADTAHEEQNTVANSAEESTAFTLGGSLLLNNGYVGIAAERLDKEYGIPGHSHGGHEGESVAVYADLEQERYQLISELTFDSTWLRAINTRAAYSDYTHAEIEEGVAGTVFANKTSELRVDLLHREWLHWKGAVNLHYKNSEISAEGEEAFTPPSTSEIFALALMEEKHMGNVLVQLGARVEHVTTSADAVLLPHIDVHNHDEDEHNPDHNHDEHENYTRVFNVEHEFTPVSFSIGAVWDFAPGYNTGIALSHAQRAPAATELLSFGGHIGTRTYEVGALFNIHREDDDAQFVLSEADIDLERSNNIDLSFRKYEGNLGIILNAFFNQVDNYYYQQATGLYTESTHSHDNDHAHDDEHVDELPVYLFDFEDAEFYGLEAQLIWKLSNNWQTQFFSDFVHAELSDGRYLPRTPPLRFGADLEYSNHHITGNLNWTQYTEQDQLAELETATDGYGMLNASFSYLLPVDAVELSLFIHADNLTDTEARVHTSFIKDVAPRPGRNFSLGLRGAF